MTPANVPTTPDASVRRLKRLCEDAVTTMAIDLADMRVLTEAATGAFAVTPVIAALAGAQVVAVGRDSRWGPATQAFAEVAALARACGVSERISFSDLPAAENARGADLVTNLGFVRPIDGAVIEKLSSSAVVALMWEPWEFRADDVALDSLRAHNVPLIGTNEQHPAVRTFEYLGPTIGRLLLDHGIELVGSNIVVLGSAPFGPAISAWLRASGAVVSGHLEATTPEAIDAVVVAEHRDERVMIGAEDAGVVELLTRSGTVVAWLCGNVDAQGLVRAGIPVVPSTHLRPGVMSVTTAHAGPRPVVDLHAAGLKAAGEACRARKAGCSIADSIQTSVRSGFGLVDKNWGQA